MKTVIRPETEMKDSGVKYIGLIPRTWKIVQLKYCTDCLDGKRIPIDASLRKSGIYPYWGAGKIMDYVDDYIFDERLVLLGEDGAPFFDDFRPVSHLIDGKVWVNNHIHVLRTKDNVVDSYLVHALNSVDYHEYINGSILNKLTQSNMNRIKIPLPSYREQQAIADYLDETCSKIDEIIAEAKASIDEYKELKQSVIFEAVTKGLDKNVEMKDSGNLAIGKIPKHWVKARVKNVATRITVGVVVTPANYFDDAGTVAFLRGINVKEYVINSEPMMYITEETNKELSKTIVHTNDLVIVRDGAIGVTAVVPEKYDGANVVSMIIVSLGSEYNHDYLCYVLNSYVGKIQFNLTKIGSALSHTSVSSVSNIEIPKPSINEQIDIVNYLKEQHKKLNSLIAEKESLIKDLEAYKKSLIYEVVTGKRRVV